MKKLRKAEILEGGLGINDNGAAQGRPLARQQDEKYRDKVIVRKRNPSSHPLRELRLKRGYTLRELAKITQLSASYLARIEGATRRLNDDLIKRLCVALACSPAELLPYKNDFVSSGEAAQPVKDLPVYKLTGTEANFGKILADKEADRAFRPQEVSGIRGAFACDVENVKLWFTLPRA